MQAHRDMMAAGFRVLALWPVKDGVCGCGDPTCSAAGKHPIASNWQHTPHWSDEQLETLEEIGHFETGYGVLLDNMLVIDVDERNGGHESYTRLVQDAPEITGAGMIVRTGSGGASKHLYFRLPEKTALAQSLKAYPGIDFKSSGFVVGAGSTHASGGTYQILVGEPGEISNAPDTLIELLRKPDKHRTVRNGVSVDITTADLHGMVMSVPNGDDVGHEIYIRVGMGLHEATSGHADGLAIWQEWAQQSPRYSKKGGTKIENRWHSFGKCANPVSVGTLFHYAEEAGWRAPVEFTSTSYFIQPEEPAGDDPLDDKTIDLLRPPGFAGDLVAWINSRQRHPRETLAVAAALMAISSAGGMRYTDPLDDVTANLFFFGVSGSATGKESVLKSYGELCRAAGIAAATHGKFKSEQEIYRNLVRHQAAFYAVDELGEELSKLVNARAKGTTAYLEGIIGTLMSVYTKANGFAMVTGDLKEEIKESLIKEGARINKRIDDNTATPQDHARFAALMHQLDTIESGIERPYLSIFGLTTPERFGTLMDFDMATNGFMGRALIFNEREDNPKGKPREKVTRGDVPEKIAAVLRNMYAPGHSEVFPRVECIGSRVAVPTAKDAVALLDNAEAAFYALAEDAKNSTGLTAIPRRGYELVAKISLILAMPGGLRTAEHVRWAYALVKRDTLEKIKLANSNSSADTQDALACAIMGHITTDHGETIGRIRNKCRKYKKEDVDTTLAKLVAAGHIRETETPGGGRWGSIKKYFATNA